MSKEQELICNRVECGYVGDRGQHDTAEKNTGSFIAVFGCGWFVIPIGAVAGAFIGAMINGTCVIPGLIAGASIALAMLILVPRSSTCPACRRGELVELDSEQGEALIKRRTELKN